MQQLSRMFPIRMTQFTILFSGFKSFFIVFLAVYTIDRKERVYTYAIGLPLSSGQTATVTTIL